MKKIVLLSTIFILSGCQLLPSSSNQSTESTVSSDTSIITESSVSSTEESSQESFASNDSFDNIFDEKVIGEDPYPATSLPDSIPVAELRLAMDDYYTKVLTDEEKALNHDKIEAEDLNALQTSFDTDPVYQDLTIHVDQVELTLENMTNYIVRLVVESPYEAAENLITNNDLLITNEALSQLGNHLVMLAYYDETTDTLTPFHLTNSTNSLFSLREKDEQ